MFSCSPTWQVKTRDLQGYTSSQVTIQAQPNLPIAFYKLPPLHLLLILLKICSFDAKNDGQDHLVSNKPLRRIQFPFEIARRWEDPDLLPCQPLRSMAVKTQLMIAFHTWFFFPPPSLSLMICILKILWMEKKEIRSRGEKTKSCQLSSLKQESTAGNYSFSISCSLPGNYIIFDGYILDSLFPLWNTGHFTHFEGLTMGKG